DFGQSPFDGSAFWLEVAVRTNTSMVSFIPLNPRQRLMATPYALYSLNAAFAAVAGTASNALTVASVPWSALTGVPPGLADGDNDTIYTAGSGLSLSQGNQFAVLFAGSGTNLTASRSDHTHSDGTGLTNINSASLTGLLNVRMNPGNIGHLNDGGSARSVS